MPAEPEPAEPEPREPYAADGAGEPDEAGDVADEEEEDAPEQPVTNPVISPATAAAAKVATRPLKRTDSTDSNHRSSECDMPAATRRAVRQAAP
jgi:hypothetical protein